MALVTYSSSSSSSEAEQDAEPPTKKPRRDEEQQPSPALPSKSLPPLPSTFLDLYSSTVRTSTQDDPALHGGRKRVKPHIVGNWPAHVYLEWHPASEEHGLLSSLVEAERKGSLSRGAEDEKEVHSLLQNDLGVPLPLHISLSRPLTLKSEEKDSFLRQLREVILACGAHAFECRIEALRWHPNESSTRWFLVLSVEAREELRALLRECNRVAQAFGQPLLYSQNGEDGRDIRDQFHVSVAWALKQSQCTVQGAKAILDEVVRISIPFSEVKIRIGQDVTTIPLLAARRTSR